jgi:hypothetical protein
MVGDEGQRKRLCDWRRGIYPAIETSDAKRWTFKQRIRTYYIQMSAWPAADRLTLLTIAA